jgi:hypothetical protein
MFKYSIGNRKIGKDTLIFNMGSATNCPSKQLGICNINCYAMKSERLYPHTLPFRTAQEIYWLENDSFTIAESIQTVFNKNFRTTLKYVRVNESGDFHSRKCITKLIQIALLLPKIKFYTYTHRKDLITSTTHKRLPKNLVINTSNFKRKNLNQFFALENVKLPRKRNVDNNYLLVRDEVKAQKNIDFACVGDCGKCSHCKTNHGKTIGVPYH